MRNCPLPQSERTIASPSRRPAVPARSRGKSTALRPTRASRFQPPVASRQLPALPTIAQAIRADSNHRNNPVARVFVVQVTDSAGQSDAVPECMPAYYPQSTITTIYPQNAIPTGVAQTVAVVGNWVPEQIRNSSLTILRRQQLLFGVGVAVYPESRRRYTRFRRQRDWVGSLRQLSNSRDHPYSHPSSNANFEIDLPAPAVSTFEADYLGTAGSPAFPIFACELNITGNRPHTIYPVPTDRDGANRRIRIHYLHERAVDSGHDRSASFRHQPAPTRSR